ncbi:hypothetical protein IQ249_07080 [Lusitaniella coriacea LEGE 07157]|uniref:FHA domain containing protein n=1 Tax=Lusitaniella coriacea LEGE 07157 TaxID=945747 RepID=A0A8J7DVB0_9CYAN|nr:hypothetical protein [Lusitaniella coriacea]MBE9115658.1 hypothetical protein [Lusitaniella coriacea LEGE 07157]
MSCSIGIVLSLGLFGCSDRVQTDLPRDRFSPAPAKVKVVEVSPPEVIQQLRLDLEQYQPQVTIVSPQADEVLQDTTVSVKLQVRDLPLYQNSEFGMGPHLHLILDNRPYQAVYNADEPIVFEDIEPGTHTLRVFASRPWHESFKNEGAYAQTTFHVFAETDNSAPNVGKPLLTYSRPKGSYGAEPIMLDFYLTNAPLHLVARENPDDEIEDWRVRVTVNGQSFLTDMWQPIYLEGFQPGKNWVQLELLDETGNAVENAFNNTVRLIAYEPDGQDTLSKLVRGDLSVADAKGIVDPNYVKPIPLVEEEEIPAEEEPVVEEPVFEEEEIPTEEELTSPMAEEEVIEPSLEEEPVFEEELTPPTVEEEVIEPSLEEEPVVEEELTPPMVDEEVIEPSLEEEPVFEEEEIPAEEELIPPTVEEVESSLEEKPPIVEEEIPIEQELTSPIEEEVIEPSAEEELPIVEEVIGTEEEDAVVEETVPEPPVVEEPVVEEMPAAVDTVPETISGETVEEEIPADAIAPSNIEEPPAIEEVPIEENEDTAQALEQLKSKLNELRGLFNR